MNFHRHARAIGAVGVCAAIALLANGASAQSCAVYTLDKDGKLREACTREGPPPAKAPQPKPRPKPKPKAAAPAGKNGEPARAISQRGSGQASERSNAPASRQPNAPSNGLASAPSGGPANGRSTVQSQAEPARQAEPDGAAARPAIAPPAIAPPAIANPAGAAPSGATTGNWLASGAIGLLVAVLTWFGLRSTLPGKRPRDDETPVMEPQTPR